MAIASAVCAMTGSVLGARMSLLVSESVIRHMMIVVLPIVAYHVLKNKHMGEDENRNSFLYKKCLISVIAALSAVMMVLRLGTGTFLLLCILQVQPKWIHSSARLHRLSSNIQQQQSGIAALYYIAGNVYYPLGWQQQPVL